VLSRHPIQSRLWDLKPTYERYVGMYVYMYKSNTYMMGELDAPWSPILEVVVGL
jgi:hypothetical protein